MSDRLKVAGEAIKVSIETGNRIVVGTVHMPASAYRSRLSDLLNQKDITFLSVTDAIAYGRDSNEEKFRSSYLAVNLQQIEMIRPFNGE